MFAINLVSPEGVREETDFFSLTEEQRETVLRASDEQITDAIEQASEAYWDQLAQIHDEIQTRAMRILIEDQGFDD